MGRAGEAAAAVQGDRVSRAAASWRRLGAAVRGVQRSSNMSARRAGATAAEVRKKKQQVEEGGTSIGRAMDQTPPTLCLVSCVRWIWSGAGGAWWRCWVARR